MTLLNWVNKSRLSNLQGDESAYQKQQKIKENGDLQKLLTDEKGNVCA
jgi:hypothetical protein